MAFTFKPAIYDGVSLYELPRPILAVRIHDAWNFEQLKVPLADGDTLTGHSFQGTEISLDGQLGTQAGTLKASESDMFQEMETLRGVLDVSADAEKYEFFLYHEAASATYRKFKSCSTVRFNWDLSNKTLFTYALLIHAEDPVIYTTAPGA